MDPFDPTYDRSRDRPDLPELSDLFGFSEIEEAILDGRGGAQVVATLGWLDDVRASVRNFLDAGVTTEDAQAGRALLAGLDGATRILKAPDPGKGASNG